MYGVAGHSAAGRTSGEIQIIVCKPLRSQLPHQPARVREALRVEGVGAPAAVDLPRVVDVHPRQRDLELPVLRRVREQGRFAVLGPDAPPLLRAELLQRASGARPASAVNARITFGRRAEVDLVAKRTLLEAQLDPIGRRRQRALRRHAAARPQAFGARERELADAQVPHEDPVAGGRDEVRHRKLAAAGVARALLRDLVAQVDEVAVLAATEKMLGRGRREALDDGRHATVGLEGVADVEPASVGPGVTTTTARRSGSSVATTYRVPFGTSELETRSATAWLPPSRVTYPSRRPTASPDGVSPVSLLPVRREREREGMLGNRPVGRRASACARPVLRRGRLRRPRRGRRPPHRASLSFRTPPASESSRASTHPGGQAPRTAS